MSFACSPWAHNTERRSRVNTKITNMTNLCWLKWSITGDADLGRPLGRSIQDTLLDLLHMRHMRGLDDCKHVLNQLEYLRLVPFTDLHAVFQHHDDVLRAILSSMLRAFLRRPCRIKVYVNIFYILYIYYTLPVNKFGIIMIFERGLIC